jgi:hypothetical protein
MKSMNTPVPVLDQKQGHRLVNTQRVVLIGKLIDVLCEGYHSTTSLSKKLNVSRDTIETYRPAADQAIAKLKLDRNVIRNLQVQRTYKLLEMLMGDLKGCTTVKEKTLIYNQIYKFSSHLALICGLNVETQVNVDQKQLVIIRANNGQKRQTPIEVREEESHNKQG